MKKKKKKICEKIVAWQTFHMYYSKAGKVHRITSATFSKLGQHLNKIASQLFTRNDTFQFTKL